MLRVSNSSWTVRSLALWKCFFSVWPHSRDQALISAKTFTLCKFISSGQIQQVIFRFQSLLFFIHYNVFFRSEHLPVGGKPCQLDTMMVATMCSLSLSQASKLNLSVFLTGGLKKQVWLDWFYLLCSVIWQCIACTNASELSVAAEVLGSQLGMDREELNRYKEQLLTSFKDQMELRRTLMELTSASIEISLETSRNQLVISESVALLFYLLFLNRANLPSPPLPPQLSPYPISLEWMM